jgi:beta-lactamase regulating signal transducer with metallopeptidase domain
MLDRLDDASLLAVLAHERHHLRRRDPARLLLIHAVASAAFMLPLTGTVRRRVESRIELAADRAALAVVSPVALANALLAALSSQGANVVGAANLGTNEARILQLAGMTVRGPFPTAVAVASVAFLTGISLSVTSLAMATNAVQMICARCL